MRLADVFMGRTQGGAHGERISAAPNGAGRVGWNAARRDLPLGRARAAGSAVVGFIYVGPRDDFGYNQAHAEGAAALKKMAGVKVVEEERIPETVDVAKTMESMINLDGAGLLFPTSFGYFDPYILKAARQISRRSPSSIAAACGPTKNPKNIGSYFGYIFEAQFINGIVAGYASKSGKLGFVAAKPIPQVLQNINAFTLGARLVNPKATTQAHLHRRLVAARSRRPRRPTA